MEGLPENKLLLTKASRFCAYRDRCQQEVRKKLLDLGAASDQAEEILAELISLGFVNEERFAQLYAGGKFRQKRWGRVRIRLELRKRNLTEYCIDQGLREIEEHEYTTTLESLIRKKRLDYNGEKGTVVDQKIAHYCIRKGYESDLTWLAINGTEGSS
ncbi:MAG: RecX family transcriptional regulator [Flavobacteriales bacterium]|nr:RecX family transcriptional regulator [Flavobacteriales bacterium]